MINQLLLTKKFNQIWNGNAIMLKKIVKIQEEVVQKEKQMG